VTGEEAPLVENTFRVLVDRHARELVKAATHARRIGGGRACFTRPLLHGLLCSAGEVEELLDAYGASRNLRWHPLRRAVAATKLFSQVAYHLEHVLLFLPSYRLPALGYDIRADTETTIDEVCAILVRCLDDLLVVAQECGLYVSVSAPPPQSYSEALPHGHLSADRMSHKVASPEQTVANLSTAFLNLSEESSFIHLTQQTGLRPRTEWVPDPVNEARMRDLEQRFHSLQSLYDTHITDTNIETLDHDLPVLRGHVTVIFHLLEVATGLTHYCERHILGRSEGPPEGQTPQMAVVEHGKLLDLLLGYALAYASRYIRAGRELCHEMLRRYAVQDQVTLAIPRYRGFHVRPSTLLARIVAHYGCEVRMDLEQESFNAGFTLDLFRANEKINAVKRRRLAGAVPRYLDGAPGGEAADLQEVVREVAQRLFAEGRLVLYDRSLVLEGFTSRPGEGLVERVSRAMTLLLSTGKIDVEMDITATFHGDRRVLDDIRLLAESRYGEDDFGNNLPLPPRLSYLR
jgi:hypothetical protein